MAKNNATVKADAGLKSRWYDIKEFFINVYLELKKVHWPGRRQIMIYTGVVLVMVAIVMFIIWLFDLGLSYVLYFLNNRFNS